jgi:hypothetical protein
MRFWKPPDRENPAIPEADKPNYYRPLKGKDPDEQHNLHNIRGNGVWVFQPDLRNPRCRDSFYDSSHIVVEPDRIIGPALHPAEPNQRSEVIFNVSAANVITSMLIQADVTRATAQDFLRVQVSRCAGINWETVWQAKHIGSQTIRIPLCEEVAGVTQCLVKFKIQAQAETTNVGISNLQIKTITQLNRRTLPKLTLGTNQIRLFGDEPLETVVLWPPLHNNLYAKTIHQETKLYSAEQPDGMYKATLGAGANDADCEAVWRIPTATDIRRVTLGTIVTNRSPHSRVDLS